VTGKRTEDFDLFFRLGANLAQPLGVDTAITRRTAKELFEGPVKRIVKHPIEMARDLLSVTESVARVAEGRMVAKQVGWDGSQPMTFAEAVQIGLGMKQVTVDFSATGSVGKKVNQAIPFFNANIQGTRLFSKNLTQRPARTILYGMIGLLLPTILLWWDNKDEEWYKDMPATEKHLYWHIPFGDEIIQIPRAFEYGNLFAVLPESFLDSWYRQDPKGVRDALGYVLDTTAPPTTPTILRVAKEQWQNRIDFFDSPIVPKSEVDLRPGEQFRESGTELGKALGRYFPDTVSPRRVDHLIRGMAGGAPIDVIKAVESVTGLRPTKEIQKSDYFAIGKIFRPGGQIGYGSETIEAFYDEYTRLSQKIRSKDPAVKREAGARYGEAQKVSQALKQLRDQNALDRNQESRNARTVLMREIAKRFLSGNQAGREADLRIAQSELETMQQQLKTARNLDAGLRKEIKRDITAKKKTIKRLQQQIANPDLVQLEWELRFHKRQRTEALKDSRDVNRSNQFRDEAIDEAKRLQKIITNLQKQIKKIKPKRRVVK
jgi:hypothetical protein